MSKVGRPKVNTIKQPYIPKKDLKLTCAACTELKNERDYYVSYNPVHSSGRIPYCKSCLRKMISDNNGNVTLEKLQSTLQLIDRPFIFDIYKISLEDKSDSFGIYMKNLCLKQNRQLTWKDSVFRPQLNSDLNYNKNLGQPQKSARNNDMFDLEELKEKFGFGYPDEEYYLFERKYQQLKPSIKLLTTLHDEFFREYCVDRVKETLAKSTGNFKEAKEWASMAKDAATAGKLNPNQMSKSDLSGGMDTFGQMARMVEETPKGELQSILPKFIERPKDKVDVVLWCNINYIRDLKGMPTCEYKEIYKFYDERKEQYENGMLDNNLIENEDDSNG